MKLKKFFKPLVTVSALSMLLMGCAEDSSNSNSSTTTPTAQSVFTDFLVGFQSAPAQNATALEFTTKTTDKKPLNVAKDAEAVKYLVSLDNVMATYYATFGITGTSTTLLTPQGDNSITGLSGETKIKNYAKVDKGSDTTEVQLELKNGTNSLYTGMFALMTDAKVKELDAALGDLDEAVELSKGGTDTPDITQIPVETVQKVVDLINGNMYKVAYNSPAQSVQAAFAKAETLTFAEGNSMKFTEGNSQEYKIATGELSFANANPAVVEANSTVVFLDEFKNILNGVADGETDKNTVKGKTDLTTNQNLKITTDTLSSSANSGEITYTAASAGAEAGNNKVTYIAIVESTDGIDSADSKLGALNKAIANGANKEQVEAALAELGKIYKVEYTVDTIANLIETFKASTAVTEAIKNPKNLTEEFKYTGEKQYGTSDYLYCLYETGSIKLKTFGGNDVTSSDVIAGYVNGGAGSSSSSNEIVFNGESAQDAGTYYAYCSTVLAEGFSPSGTTNYEKLVEFFNTLQAQPDGTSMQVFSYEKTAGQ